ncbi:hypothetical protein OAQ02_04055 [Candidatus Marinimicrobia bacterium]|nr:hypothetical protein [Candidatus Neomarinimicrobiota bacterium]
MKRKYNTVGGGAKTNINGLSFERDTDLLDAFNSLKNYHINVLPYDEAPRTGEVFKNNKLIGLFFEQNSLYKRFLEPKGINALDLVSTKLRPDSVFINLINDTVYIIEKKYQAQSGSVDEKLQTCHYKKRYYKKLFKNLNLEVEFYYILNNWFTQERYKDVFDYIDEVGCKKFINFIPFEDLGIK